MPCLLGLENTPTTPLQRSKTPTLHEYLRYDTKLSDGKAPVLELWGMRSTPLLPITLRFTLA